MRTEILALTVPMPRRKGLEFELNEVPLPRRRTGSGPRETTSAACDNLRAMRYAALCALLVWGYATAAATPGAGGCTYTYFSDGGTAGSRCTDETGATATVRVYDHAGEVIGEWNLMLRPRTSSIDMTFHPDGMVRRVRYSWQPDGGIQWYRSTTVYDADGTVVDFYEASHDMFDRIRAVDPSL